MDDKYIGYGLSAILIITNIITSTIKNYKEKRKTQEDAIAMVSAERATLNMKCENLTKTADRMEEAVKENYNVLAGQLSTLQETMYRTDGELIERVGKVEIRTDNLEKVVGEHSKSINRLQNKKGA